MRHLDRRLLSDFLSVMIPLFRGQVKWLGLMRPLSLQCAHLTCMHATLFRCNSRLLSAPRDYVRKQLLVSLCSFGGRIEAEIECI